MAEMVGSLVVGEIVSRTSSFLLSRHRDRLAAWEAMERLEMAHIKMEAALDVSARWQPTTDASLLHWRRKLRRAADDCDAALCRWKLRALEEEDARERLARAPLHRRVAHAVASLVGALVALIVTTTRGGRGDDEVSRACAAVRRFETLASGAAEFLRCVQLSSAAREYCFVGPAIVRSKLVGDDSRRANQSLLQGAPRGLLGGGSRGPAEDWVQRNKPCSRGGYGRRRGSGKKLLQV